MDIANASLQDFQGIDSEEFTVDTDNGTTISLRLIEKRDLSRDDDNSEKRSPFSLLFRAAPDIAFAQGTYLVRHENLGEFALFLVPVRLDEDGICYETIFS